ncbi:hypothetical protein [Fusobacterium gastrosuis]|uniref:hypothetical protein n=1 Tax=Fusobacterium gastrosuis TaxID=1755100 RepID=UPI0029747B93|nr:hypothetical protein [Fusobacteriaceae bacterium]MDY5713000.1 hypothetical protein [Fusobacterium gastrosuis]
MKKFYLGMILYSLFFIACQKTLNENDKIEETKKIEYRLNEKNFKKYELYLDLYNDMYIENKMINDFLEVFNYNNFRTLNKELSNEQFIKFERNFSKNIDAVNAKILKIKRISEEEPKLVSDKVLWEMEEIFPKLKIKLSEVTKLYNLKNENNEQISKVYDEFYNLYENYLEYENQFITEIKGIENTRFENLVIELKEKGSDIDKKVDNFKVAAKIFLETISNQDNIAYAMENEEIETLLRTVGNLVIAASNDITEEIKKFSTLDENQVKYANFNFYIYRMIAEETKEIVISVDNKNHDNLKRAISGYIDKYLKIINEEVL